MAVSSSTVSALGKLDDKMSRMIQSIGEFGATIKHTESDVNGLKREIAASRRKHDDDLERVRAHLHNEISILEASAAKRIEILQKASDASIKALQDALQASDRERLAHTSKLAVERAQDIAKAAKLRAQDLKDTQEWRNKLWLKAIAISTPISMIASAVGWYIGKNF